MTREEVLAALENAKLHAAFERDVEILDACVSALREQEERSKGCSYCEGAKLGDILVSRRDGDTITYKHKALCCPECGRRLEE